MTQSATFAESSQHRRHRVPSSMRNSSSRLADSCSGGGGELGRDFDAAPWPARIRKASHACRDSSQPGRWRSISARQDWPGLSRPVNTIPIADIARDGAVRRKGLLALPLPLLMQSAHRSQPLWQNGFHTDYSRRPPRLASEATAGDEAGLTNPNGLKRS